jgi:hypothetical protein
MRGTGIVSPTCESGLLDELVSDEELELLEESPVCAIAAAASTSPATTKALAIGVIGRGRNRMKRFRLDTIRIRRSQ